MQQQDLLTRTRFTITDIHKKTADKTGKPYVTKDGRPFTRLEIKTASTGDELLSAFENALNKNWAVGQEVDAKVVVKENGYKNLEALSKTDILEIRVISLETKVRNLERALLKDNLPNDAKVKPEVSEEEIQAELSEPPF